MAIKPDEDASPASTDTTGEPASRRTSELDLTKRSTGPVWRLYLRATGPGLVTGASDDDPSGIAAHSRAGAHYGLAFLWSALLTLPLMAAVQEICDRTALATGTGLGELAVKRFGRAGRAIVAVLLVLGSYARIALVCKLLCAALLAYLVVAVLVTHQWGSVLTHNVVPHIEMNQAYLALLVAVLGTTMSPYLFFWQSAHRLEDVRDAPEGGTHALPLKRHHRARAAANRPPAALMCSSA